jgi:hypothetical protein
MSKIKWKYVDTYIDGDEVECPTCHSIVDVSLDGSVVTEHECSGCGSRLQLKHTISHLTELYIEKENDNGKTKNEQEVS